MPHANSTTSWPRATSPRASECTLPCSAVMIAASSSLRELSSSRKRKTTWVRALTEVPRPVDRRLLGGGDGGLDLLGAGEGDLAGHQAGGGVGDVADAVAACRGGPCRRSSARWSVMVRHRASRAPPGGEGRPVAHSCCTWDSTSYAGHRPRGARPARAGRGRPGGARRRGRAWTPTSAGCTSRRSATSARCWSATSWCSRPASAWPRPPRRPPTSSTSWSTVGAAGLVVELSAAYPSRPRPGAAPGPRGRAPGGGAQPQGALRRGDRAGAPGDRGGAVRRPALRRRGAPDLHRARAGAGADGPAGRGGRRPGRRLGRARGPVPPGARRGRRGTSRSTGCSSTGSGARGSRRTCTGRAGAAAPRAG